MLVFLLCALELSKLYKRERERVINCIIRWSFSFIWTFSPQNVFVMKPWFTLEKEVRWNHSWDENKVTGLGNMQCNASLKTEIFLTNFSFTLLYFHSSVVQSHDSNQHIFSLKLSGKCSEIPQHHNSSFVVNGQWGEKCENC